MACQDHNPTTFADGDGTTLECYRCGRLVKFMHGTPEQLAAFHRHGRTCRDCEESVRREGVVRGWQWNE